MWGSATPSAPTSTAGASRVRLGDLPDVPRERLPCAEPWRSVLGGGLVLGSTVLVYGPAGIGKTTELVRLAASLGDRVLFACHEMGQDPASLHDVARRGGVDARSLWVAAASTLGEFCAEVSRPPPPRAVVLDSLSSLAPRSEVDALTALRRSMPRDSALIAIVHVTKAGEMAGAEALAHACDTVVRLTATTITTEGEKNRYGKLATADRSPFTSG